MKKYLVFIIPIFLISCKESQNPELVVPVGHMGNINAICFSHDGKYLVTAGEDKTVKVWDITRGKLLYDLQGHTDEVYTARFDPAGEDLITVSRDNSIRRWDISNGKELSCFISSDMIDSRSVSADGNYMIAEEPSDDPDSDAGLLCLREIRNKGSKVLSRIPGYKAFFTPDGMNFIYISQDGYLEKAVTRTGSPLLKMGKTELNIMDVEFSQDGRFVGVMTEDSLKIWDSFNGALLARIRDTTYEYIDASTFSHDGNKIAVAGLGKINIYEVSSGNMLEIIDLDTIRLSIVGMEFSNDDKKLLVLTYGGDALLWDFSQNKLSHRFPGNSPAAFSPDGSYIALSANYQLGYYSREQDQIPKIFDPGTGKILLRLEGHSKYISQAQFNKTGNSVLTDSWDLAAICWDIENGRLVSKMKSELLNFESVKYSPDNKYILTTAVNETAVLWDAASGKFLFSMKGDTTSKASYGRVFTAKFSPDSKLIFTSYTSDSSVKVFDIQTENLKYAFRCIPPVSYVSFNNDGSLLAIISGNGTADLWDLKTGLKKNTLSNDVNSPFDSLLKYGLESQTVHPTQAVITRDGKFVITTINNETSEVWDTERGKLLYTFSKNFQESSSPFSADSKYFITTSYDSSYNNNTNLVDINNGKIKFSFNGSFDEGGNHISPDNNFILTQKDDNLLV